MVDAVSTTSVVVWDAAPAKRASTSEVRVPWRTAVAVGLGALAFSLAGSWIPSIWGDEATSILSAERPLSSLLRMLGHVDAVHGTYYLLLRFWVDAFGASSFSIRLPSALAVGAAAAGVVLLATRLGGARAGLWAGIVFAALPRTTYMGEEARDYALGTACAVWATIVLVRAISAERRRPLWWLVYAVSVAACGYVFLFSLLILIPHSVLALRSRVSRIRASWIVAGAGAVLLSAPVIIFGVAERAQVAYLVGADAATLRSVLVGQWFGALPLAALGWAGVIAGAVLLVRGMLARRARVPGAAERAPLNALLPLGIAWMLGPTAALLLVNLVEPVYVSRYLSFTAPAVGLVLGALAARLRPAWLGAALVVVLLAASAPVYLSERTPFAKNDSDWAFVASAIATHARPGDGILFDEGAHPSQRPRLAMAAYPAAFTSLIDIALDRPAADTNGWSDSTLPLARVLHRLDGVSSVWLIEYRQPDRSADTYDLAELRRAGFAPANTIPGHASEIIHLLRT